jgi:hypothetical protein
MQRRNGILAAIGAGSALTAAAVVGGLLVAAVLGFHAWIGPGVPDAAADSVLPAAPRGAIAAPAVVAVTAPGPQPAVVRPTR